MSQIIKAGRSLLGKLRSFRALSIQEVIIRERLSNPKSNGEIPLHWQQKKQTEINNKLDKFGGEAGRRMEIKVALLVIFGACLYHLQVVDARKVLGQGHNLIRRMIIEVRESPTFAKVTVDLNPDSIPTLSRSLSSVGLSGQKWIFNAQQQTANISLDLVLTTTQGREIPATVVGQAHVVECQKSDLERADIPGFNKFVGDMLYHVSLFYAVFMCISGFLVRKDPMQPLPLGMRWLFSKPPVSRVFFYFVLVLSLSAMEKYKPETFWGAVYLLPRIFKSDEDLGLLTENLDPEVDEKYPVPWALTDQSVAFLSKRIFHAYSSDVEYRTTNAKWEIDNLIISVEHDGKEKQMWIKKEAKER